MQTETMPTERTQSETMPPRAMQIGIQLPEVERFVAWPEVIAMAKRAEAVGFDALWLGDHLLYDLPNPAGGSGATSTIQRGPWEVWTSLAAIAAVTTRIELGPLVASTSFHAPAMLAKQAATVDAISGGRLIAGLGAGWNEREYTAFGFAYDRRVSRFEEAFTIIRTLLREHRIDFSGQFNELRDCVIDPPPSRPGGPPLMIGSVSDRMLRITLPHVDAWNVWWALFGNTPEGFAEVRERVEQTCVEVGRDPAEVQATAAVYLQLDGGAGRVMGDVRGRRMVPVRGTQQEIADQLAGFAAAGAASIQLVVDPITEASIDHLGGVLELLRR
ncbi:MAG: class flavin-dependent oxidoreductase [Ilumatobacteraceae bacterium]|nr:class flavin-dependent oxidoreductase [Ilumatobacteraceae bacterium]